jgi:triacylglycerol esterase/lipase EstA (alpha/beta hydrolase family)
MPVLADLRREVSETLSEAVDTVRHSAHYTRHLLRGHRVKPRLARVAHDSVPVVLVHGFMATRGTMEPLTHRLQQDGRVVFSYAHGNFNLAALETTAHELVAQVKNICEELGASKVDIVGYSMGGLLGLHAVKSLGGHRWIRKVIMLGSPLRGSWLSIAGVACVGMISPAAWQLLPGSTTLEKLRNKPLPAGVDLYQIHAVNDLFCRDPGRLPEVAHGNYVRISGGHSTLVVAENAYAHVRRFLADEESSPVNAQAFRGSDEEALASASR